MDSFQILLEKTEKQKDYRQGAISVLDERGKFVSFKNQDFIGVLHIYKHKIPESYSSVSNLSNILAFLAVPSYFSTQSLLSFIGKYQSCISNFRIIRDSLDSRYLVLMKFATRDDADLFYAEFNGSLYNHDQGERCHVVYISSVLFSSNNELEPLVLEESDVFFTNIDSIKDKIELPNCPDRMDSSVTGLLTIVCRHTFHCHCIAKWGDSSCPVCRHSDIYSHSKKDKNVCGTCNVTDNLWICLICGNVGCGRYSSAHAFDHHQSSGHLYALELETQRVWDYLNDGYVHRLIVNKVDGKLVELHAPASNIRGPVPDRQVNTNDTEKSLSLQKLDHISLEYTYLLTSQLDSQRLHYETQLAQFQNSLNLQLDAIGDRVTELELERDFALESSNQKSLELIKVKSNVDSLVQKQAHISDLYKNSLKKLGEEEALNKSLLENQGKYIEKIEILSKNVVERDLEIEELKEQTRDLMAFINVSDKIEKSGLKDEIIDGKITVGEKPVEKPKTKSKKKR